jgi:protein tyrosine phosphatase type 4A
MSALINPPSLVTYGALRFLIVDSPSDLNIEAYVKEFKTNNVTDVVRACEPSYRVDRLEKAGIHVHVMPC